MTTTRKNLISDEVATLTGKVYAGDVTPLVYELLKDTGDKQSLLSYLTGEVNVNVDNQQSDSTVREKGSNRLSVKEWISNCEQL